MADYQERFRQFPNKTVVESIKWGYGRAITGDDVFVNDSISYWAFSKWYPITGIGGIIAGALFFLVCRASLNEQADKT
jgi:hypothetical protein